MTDEDWMRMALNEARKGIGKTAPNPPVGAVIVKGDVLLGSGWHRKAGQPHAEREALADARAKGHDVSGSTAYVTLEPCSTHGRTPPCVDALIDAGIKRVVYACADENLAHAGRADAILENARIHVASGVLASEAREILRPFFKTKRTGLPWVIWKTAMSLDGFLTRPPGEGQWLTSEAARADVQRLRSTVDAILTSGETVRRDDPALTIRMPNLLAGREQPWRVVFTDRAETLENSRVLTDEWKHHTLIRPRACVEETLRQLVVEQGATTCMTECGGVFSSVLFHAGLIDEVAIYQAPILCGGGVPALAGCVFPASVRLEQTRLRMLGGDALFTGLIVRS